MTGILSEIISLLTGGIADTATAIGKGLSTLAKSVFIETVGEGASATTQLSVFGSLIVIFAGIGLAFGLSRWVVNFCTSLGARNR